MKKQLLKHLTKTVFVTLLVTISYYSFTNGTGAPAGNSYAPGDPSSGCTQGGCHGGSAITSGTNWNNMTITHNIPANGYTPGASYTITVSHAIAGINKWGFQLSVINGSFTQAGTLVAGTGSQTVSSGGRTYVTHNSSGNSGTGSKSWSFTWVAPSAGSGIVSFYAAVNAANGDNSNSGDQIYTKSLSVQELSNLPTAVIGGIPSNGNVCLGDTLSLTGSGINAPTSYAWTFSGINNPTLQAQQNPKVIFTSATLKTITLTTTNSFGPSTTTTVFVNVVAKPSATISPSGSVAICGNDSVTLNANFNPLFTYVWSPGNETASSIKTVAAGTYKVKVTNTTTGCFANSANVTLTAQAKPVPVLTVSKDSICSEDSLTLTSSTPFTTYAFFNNSTLLSSSNSSSLTAKLPAGMRNIGLVVTGSGCSSDTVRKAVFVQPLLPAPSLSCGTKTTSSVSFNWTAISGTSGYEVSVDTGKTWSAPNGSLTHTINGLSPNSNVQMWARAVDSALCSRGNTGSLVCTNGACSPLTYSIQVTPTVCLSSITDSAMTSVTLSNISASNVGISFNNNSYTKSFVYDAKVLSGNNSVSLKIVDSSNVGCPRIDTIIQITGISPISKKPILGVQGALCSGDSAVHVIEVFNANSAADQFKLFRNAEVTAFETINSTGGDTVRISIPRAFSPIQSGDVLTVIAVDAPTGCTIPSLPYTATVFASPKAGFTTEVSSLTVTLVDTTFKTAKRDWKFLNVIPDELNAAKSVTKIFPSAGIKSAMMVVTDSNGCIEKASSQFTLFNVGLTELSRLQPLVIHPNPVSSEVNITLTDKGNALVTIYDIHGKLIKQVELKDAEKKVDTQTLTPGLYLLYLTQENTNYFTKFMKE